jgi:hypothetical protein
MSTAALQGHFYASTAGKKAVMAVGGHPVSVRGRAIFKFMKAQKS